MSNKLTVPMAIILGGIIVAIAVYASIHKKPSSGQGAIHAELIRPVDSSDHIFGNPAAKVMVIEYSDFDCEYCKIFDATTHRVIADEGAAGRVAWVYREFPLIEIHPNAMANAEAAECAAQTAGNDAFWSFKTELFSHQPIDPSQYGTYAQSVGISGDSFATCYSDASTTVAARIMADRKNALDIGANGTPFSIILVAGKPPVVMRGGYSYDAVKALVDQALQ